MIGLLLLMRWLALSRKKNKMNESVKAKVDGHVLEVTLDRQKANCELLAY